MGGARMGMWLGPKAAPGRRVPLGKEEPAPEAGIARRMVLIADDDAGIRKSLGRSLSQRGYEVQFAEHGRAALGILEGPGVDLVILDLLMPGMDGLETCRRIRALPFGREVPILMLTGDTREGLDEVAIDGGADDLLRKPVRLPELLVRVNALLRMGTLLSSLRQSAEQIRLQHEQIEAARQERDRMNDFLLRDLKQPLAAIHLKAQAALQEAPPRDRPAWAAMAEACAGACGLLSGWLDLNDLGRGLGADLEFSAPGDWARPLRETVEPWLRVKGLRFEFHCDENVPDLWVDRTLMLRLLANLLDHAIARSPRGGAIGVEVFRAAQDRAQIVVSDEGPNLPRREWKRALEIPPGGPDPPRFQGSGLAFCRIAAEALGGRLWVDSPLAGTGACYIVELPLHLGGERV